MTTGRTPQAGRTPAFSSILGPDSGDGADCDAETLLDLALDQVIEVVAAGGGEELADWYRRPAGSLKAVKFRQDVFDDLDGKPSAPAVTDFVENMRLVRNHVDAIEDLEYRYEIEGRLLEAVSTYCSGVEAFRGALGSARPRSAGLKALLVHLREYTGSDEFKGLERDGAGVLAELAKVRYGVHIDGPRVRVSHSWGDVDLRAKVTETFERFGRGTGIPMVVEDAPMPRMSGVEREVIDRVAILFPEPFAALDDFFERHHDFLSPMLVRFDREVQFYLSYLDFIRPLREEGLPFVRASVTSKHEVHARGTFDLALADRLLSRAMSSWGRVSHFSEDREDDGPESSWPEGTPAEPGSGLGMVLNDLDLGAGERAIVVTGPNQGGKTTFARLFGQLHVLASLGLPVPGKSVEVGLADAVLTHFEREEQVTDLKGKLEADLIRIREVLDRATADSVLVFNEAFTSASLQDARELGRHILSEILDRGSRCVYVTFVDELASLDPAVVSAMSTIEPGDLAKRTFRIVRKPADGLAYALAVAREHRLTRDQLIERLKR